MGESPGAGTTEHRSPVHVGEETDEAPAQAHDPQPQWKREMVRNGKGKDSTSKIYRRL